jgi:hypothetical protein
MNRRTIPALMAALALLLGVPAAALAGGGGLHKASATHNPHHEEADGCDHGATGKPCRPDPQPTRGKDCVKHGNHGGVNEDHCKGGTPTPTKTHPTKHPTPTTTGPTWTPKPTKTHPHPTKTTRPPKPTVTVSPSPSVTPSPSSPTVRTSPVLRPSPATTSSGSVTHGPRLAPVSGQPTEGELAYTGVPDWLQWLLVVGAGLVIAGGLLWYSRRYVDRGEH